MTRRLAQGAFLETNIGAAATIDIGAIATLAVNVSSGGGASCTSFGSKPNCWRPLCRASVAFTLVDGASLITGTGANISVAIGDTWSARSDPSGVWRITGYKRASGKALVPPAFSEVTAKPTTLAGYGITDGATDTELADAVVLRNLKTANLSDVANPATAFANIKQDASASATGVVELATDAETETGTDTARAVTPANVASAYIKKSLLTTRGDIIRRGASSPERLALGTSGYALKSDGTDAVWAPSREVLTAVRTYYVRTDGNDSNTGLVDSAGGAFLTLQKAWDTVAGLDLNGLSVTIDVGDGTYTGGVLANPKVPVGGGTVAFVGNSGTPANVVISPTGASCFNFGITMTPLVTINGFKLQTTTSGSGIAAASVVNVTFSNVEFGACASLHMQTSTDGARIVAATNYTVSGGALIHCDAIRGRIDLAGRTVTLTGTPAFSTAFARAQVHGFLSLTSMTFSGSATGPRYSVSLGGVINTNGGGATYLPGNAAGSETVPGYYL